MEQVNLTRNTWSTCVALHLHLKFKWEPRQAVNYAKCLTSTYYDDPEWCNEDGEIVSPEEAILADMEYWEQ